MGFVSEELNETEKQLIKGGKAGNMAVVYGKDASIWKVSPARPSSSPRPPERPAPGFGSHPPPPALDGRTRPPHGWKKGPLAVRTSWPGGSQPFPSLPPLFATSSGVLYGGL